MKYALLSLASAAFLLPIAFPHVIEGCSDPDYRFATLNSTPTQILAATDAKQQFCKTASVYLELAR